VAWVTVLSQEVGEGVGGAFVDAHCQYRRDEVNVESLVAKRAPLYAFVFAGRTVFDAREAVVPDDAG
jgi:hypothetical protein